MSLKKWEKKERKDAKTFGGRRQPGSGNKWNSPGDIKSDKYLIDSKFTEKNSYALSLKTLEKLYEEALFSYKIPILSVEISPSNKEKREVVIMFKEDWQTLLGETEDF